MQVTFVYFVFLTDDLLFLKCYCDENCTFSINASLKYKQVACMRRKMLFTIFVPEIFNLNMQISQVMMSYTPSNLINYDEKKISQPICIRNV